MQIKIDPKRFSILDQFKGRISQLVSKLLTKKEPSIRFVIFFSVGMFLYSFGLYTAGVVSQRNYGVSNLLFKPIILDNYKILERQFLSYFESPILLRIDIKHKNLQKLEFNRQSAIAKGTIHGVDNEWINIKIQSENSGRYSAKIRLKGATAQEHLIDDKWSFKIKIKGKNRFLQMKEFAVMDPMRRNLLGEWFIRKVFQKEGVISRKYEFVEVVINGKSKGIYVIDERYDNVMLERNHLKEGPVMKLDQTPYFSEKAGYHPSERDDYYMQMDFTAFNKDKFLKDKILRKQFVYAKNLIEHFRLGLLNTHQVFDIDKLAKWVAISDVMGAWHGFGFANMRFYFNPITTKFEPVPDDNYNERAYNFAAPFRLFRLNDSYNEGTFLKQLFSDYVFTKRYLNELERVSKQTYLDSIFKEFSGGIRSRSLLLAKDYPLYNFLLDSKNYTYQNAETLRGILNPFKGVQSYIKDKTNKGLLLQLANNKTVPMEILYLTNKTNTKFTIKSLDKYILGGRDFNTPISYKNLFFEYDRADNLTEVQLDGLSLVYRVLGTSVNRKAPIFPFQAFESNIDEYQKYNSNKISFKKFNFLSYENDKKEIIFKRGTWTLDKDLVIPQGYTLIANEGTQIDLINSSMIYSYSPIVFIGAENSPIKVFSSDSTGQGITVIKAKRSSLLKYVSFHNLSRPSKGDWELSGVINFYESPVSMYETHFEHNISGDDYVNIIRSEFTLNRTSFIHSFADALDVDFGEGKIKDSKFMFCGFQGNNGDCLDFSGSIVEIDNVLVKNAGDKGISLGEQSTLSIVNSRVDKTKIGVAVKDLSTATITGMTISDSEIGLTAFQKKPEFGPGTIVAEKINMKNVKQPYLKETNSIISVDSHEITKEINNVRSIIYSSDN
jgi:hypothetical protein